MRAVFAPAYNRRAMVRALQYYGMRSVCDVRSGGWRYGDLYGDRDDRRDNAGDQRSRTTLGQIGEQMRNCKTQRRVSG